MTKQSVFLQEIAALLSVIAQKQNFSRTGHSRQTVIPGKAVGHDPESRQKTLDSRLRGNDDQGGASCFCCHV